MKKVENIKAKKERSKVEVHREKVYSCNLSLDSREREYSCGMKKVISLCIKSLLIKLPQVLFP